MAEYNLKYELFPKQFGVFDSQKRIIVAIAGIQGGKTTVGAIRMAGEIANAIKEKKPLKYLISAPTYKILSQSTIPKFLEVAPFLKSFYRKTDNVIEVPVGKEEKIVIYIRSTEDPNKLEGMTITGMAWMDEAGQMKRDAFINIQGRTSIAQAPILITTTPYALNWLFLEVYKPFKEGKNTDTVDLFEWSSVDNPYFPKTEFERARKEMDPRVFKRRYLAMFEKMSGLVYEDFGQHLIMEPETIPFKEIICGIDWGFNNPAAIAIIGIDKENTFYLIDEYYETNKTKAEIIERLKYFKSLHNIRLWYPDPEDPEALEQMKLAGLYPREVIKGKGSVRKGIDVVRELLRRNQFKVFSTCHNSLDEFGTYHYPEETDEGNEEEEPIKEFDHLMDAIRYAIMTYQPKVDKFKSLEDVLFEVKMKEFREKKFKNKGEDPNKLVATSIY
jgi:PBSX family phage terminase large subunit